MKRKENALETESVTPIQSTTVLGKSFLILYIGLILREIAKYCSGPVSSVQALLIYLRPGFVQSEIDLQPIIDQWCFVK